MTSFNSVAQFIQLKALGRGGFGVAAHVRHNATGNEYVLKQVDLNAIRNVLQNRPELAEKAIDMARKEHTKMMQCSHPNIVQAYGAFEEDSQDMMTQGHRMYYLVMEYCQGGDLHYLITRTKWPIPGQQIRKWAMQLVSAVYYLHREELFHRDINPRNVFLVDNQQTCKLGDFGLAKEAAEVAQSTSSFTAIGTPLFCAPEYFQKKPYTAKGDIWSLGATLYNVATLNLPFESQFDIISNVIKPDDISLEYPRYLADFILGMLEKDSARRPGIEQVMTHAFLQQDSSYSSLSQSSFGQDMPAAPNHGIDARSNLPPPSYYSADRGDLFGSSPAISFSQMGLGSESMASANNFAEPANPQRPSSGYIDLPSNIQPASCIQIEVPPNVNVPSMSSIYPPIPSSVYFVSSPSSSNDIYAGDLGSSGLGNNFLGHAIHPPSPPNPKTNCSVGHPGHPDNMGSQIDNIAASELHGQGQGQGTGSFNESTSSSSNFFNFSMSQSLYRYVNFGSNNNFENASFEEIAAIQREQAPSPATNLSSNSDYRNSDLFISAPNGQNASLGSNNKFQNADLQILIDPPNGCCKFGNSNNFRNADFVIEVCSELPYRHQPIDCGSNNNFSNCTFNIRVL